MQSKAVHIAVRFRTMTASERDAVVTEMYSVGWPGGAPSDQDVHEYMATTYIGSGQTRFSEFEDGFRMWTE